MTAKLFKAIKGVYTRMLSRASGELERPHHKPGVIWKSSKALNKNPTPSWSSFKSFWGSDVIPPLYIPSTLLSSSCASTSTSDMRAMSSAKSRSEHHCVDYGLCEP